MSGWTEKERTTAVALFHDYGAKVAAKYADTSRQTIHNWVRRAERVEEQEQLEAATLPAVHVVVGDVIEWCGRQAQVLDIEPTLRGKPGRWFTVDVDGEQRRLHWYNHERVRPGCPTPEGRTTDGSE